MIAQTPEPPYYAVIFTTLRTEREEGYAETAARMEELAARQPGYLGLETVRNQLGVTVSYWRDLASIRSWKEDLEHSAARERGRREWYAAYKLRVARVEYDYDFAADESDPQ